MDIVIGLDSDMDVHMDMGIGIAMDMVIVMYIDMTKTFASGTDLVYVLLLTHLSHASNNRRVPFRSKQVDFVTTQIEIFFD